ncbi:MAG TPA: trypsin-like serine protease, partial [Polyangiaceae bacterium]|nr:trypsin-like serine protease [Polyangiaceae bacterium]
MKITLACGFLMLSVSATACSGGADSEGVLVEGAATEDSAILRPTATGGRDQIVMLYITVLTSSGFATRTCSGTYFAPRVVLTAAHCLENAYLDQVFVYYGDNFTQDFPQLTQQGNLLVPPAPGSASVWAKADSFEKHPQWDPKLVHPDMGVVYLDRKLPFDPLPLARFRLDST